MADNQQLDSFLTSGTQEGVAQPAQDAPQADPPSDGDRSAVDQGSDP